MIPLNTPICQAPPATDAVSDLSWQQHLAQAIRHPEELLTALKLNSGQLHPALIQRICNDSGFPLRIPRGYVARMKPGDPQDPLLLQVLPLADELDNAPGFLTDPVGDDAAQQQPGLLHKYHGRVLLITTAACPVHCRYCFRRHFDYSENQLDLSALETALAYIQNDRSIEEVILSGGDPLSLSNQRLADITQRLKAIPHLRRLRIHTRMPIVLPERVDDGLLDWLGELPWQTIMVTHCNHANEIDGAVQEALRKLKSTGLTLLNQSVLLKYINDDSRALVALSESLFSAGVLPYYLHLLDRVKGAHHFEVTEYQAMKLYQDMQSQLPGYLVPKLVREIAGRPYKVNLAFENNPQ